MGIQFVGYCVLHFQLVGTEYSVEINQYQSSFAACYLILGGQFCLLEFEVLSTK